MAPGADTGQQQGAEATGFTLVPATTGRASWLASLSTRLALLEVEAMMSTTSGLYLQLKQQQQ